MFYMKTFDYILAIIQILASVLIIWGLNTTNNDLTFTSLLIFWAVAIWIIVRGNARK